ncbi:DUF2171 domain-containing protein [Sphingomonas sp. HDW15A]|uniref:DUF2171 domain-containing protein n=1 Tax=Sphingomonas sp. HDW15A TaxID=2714942 RepID=UPI00140EEED5|nr:DUF2171 domain-containing protein [Sphingomonas sp. HDW15A]QIK95401.1 DUF2171 domain-containing protein [Sphingomonas sp. HDW15A]
MAYDRYDERRRHRDPRGRQYGDDREERGFFERARDEVSSWFGDDEAERRRDRDERYDDDQLIGRDRSRTFSADRDYDRYERSARWRDEGYRRPYTGRQSGRSDYGSESGGYRPFTGDYGRSSEFERESAFDRSGYGSNWDRGQSQRGWGSGASASGLHDRDYTSWRSRQIDELDRDYDEFRRENSSRFETEFGTWRQNRESKKQLVSQLTEHMEVVGSDNEPIGKIDHIKSDRIILTKNDSPDGRHHVIGCSRFDRVEDGRLILDQPAAQIQQSFEAQKRSRALFEDERPDDSGPHMLNRSFSGTY